LLGVVKVVKLFNVKFLIALSYILLTWSYVYWYVKFLAMRLVRGFKLGPPPSSRGHTHSVDTTTFLASSISAFEARCLVVD